AVGGPTRERRKTVSIVGDPSGHRQEPAVEVVDTRCEDRSPAGEEAPVGVQRLVVADAPGQVVPRLVARGVDAPSFEEKGTELIAPDDIDEPGAHVALDLPDRAVGSKRLGVPGS